MIIDPETYNWEELKGEDAVFMQGYNAGIRTVLSRVDLMAKGMSECTDGYPETFAKLYCEIAGRIHETLEVDAELCRTDLTCQMMEANPEIYCKD